MIVVALTDFNQSVATPPSTNVNEPNVIDLTGLDDDLATRSSTDAEVQQFIDDMEVGFVHDVVCDWGIFPTVEDTRMTIAESIAKSTGYGEGKEKFMPVGSFLAKMKRCLEDPKVCHADILPQLKHWILHGFQLVCI